MSRLAISMVCISKLHVDGKPRELVMAASDDAWSEWYCPAGGCQTVLKIAHGFTEVED